MVKPNPSPSAKTPAATSGSLVFLADTSTIKPRLALALSEWAGPSYSEHIHYLTCHREGWFKVPIWLFGVLLDLPFTSEGNTVDWWTDMEAQQRPFVVTAADLDVVQ